MLLTPARSPFSALPFACQQGFHDSADEEVAWLMKAHTGKKETESS